MLKKRNYFKIPQNLVKEVRGIALMIGLVAIENNEILIQKLREERLLVVKAGMNVIRMLPFNSGNKTHSRGNFKN